MMVLPSVGLARYGGNVVEPRAAAVISTYGGEVGVLGMIGAVWIGGEDPGVLTFALR